MSERTVLTTKEAAARLGYHRNTVERLLRQGKLRGFQLTRPRGQWRIPESAIRELETLRREGG